MIALPVCAQRGGGRGGFSGHGTAASHGGFGTSAPARGSSGYRSSGYRGAPASRSPGVVRGFQRGGAGYSGARAPYTGSNGHRSPYRRDYRRGAGYLGLGYGSGYGWIGPYGPGYADDNGYSDSAAPATNDSSGYQEPQYPDQSQYPDQPAAPSQPAAVWERPSPVPEEAVTLIFKDGRPPEQIHNYLLTRTTLFVGDEKRRAIPTDDLDLVATAKANREAGVDFRLPEMPR